MEYRIFGGLVYCSLGGFASQPPWTPRKYGLGTPQYGDYVRTSWKNVIFSSKWRDFSCRRSNWLQIAKNNFLRFFALYPLISAFHALWRSFWNWTWRDLSFRIINSSFHAVWLDIRKSIENLSKVYRKSIENLSNIYRKSIENLSNIYRKSIENLSKIYRTSMEWWSTLGLLWANFGSSRRLWRLMWAISTSKRLRWRMWGLFVGACWGPKTKM